MSHRETIIGQIHEVFEEEGLDTPGAFPNDMVLLDCGLDSLAFAILVTKLSGTLGFDPFVESETPYYPETLGQFVAFYDARS